MFEWVPVTQGGNILYGYWMVLNYIKIVMANSKHKNICQNIVPLHALKACKTISNDKFFSTGIWKANNLASKAILTKQKTRCGYGILILCIDDPKIHVVICSMHIISYKQRLLLISAAFHVSKSLLHCQKKRCNRLFPSKFFKFFDVPICSYGRPFMHSAIGFSYKFFIFYGWSYFIEK